MPSYNQLFYSPYDIIVAKEDNNSKKHYFMVLLPEFLDYATPDSSDYICLFITTGNHKKHNEHIVEIEIHGKKAYIVCNKMKRIPTKQIEGKKKIILTPKIKQTIFNKIHRYFNTILEITSEGIQ